MAKSNRESKKPKKEKVKIIAAAPSQKGATAGLAAIVRIRQKEIERTVPLAKVWILTSASSVMLFNNSAIAFRFAGTLAERLPMGLNRLPAISEELYLTRSLAKARER
jgi:hypothetical protein